MEGGGSWVCLSCFAYGEIDLRGLGFLLTIYV
jgi:hypothetical protein